MGVMAWTDGMHGRLGIASDVYAAAPAFGVAACTFQIPFQLYELACAALVKRLRGKSFEMVIHHALSLTLASMAVNKGMYFFYGTYFFGLSEFSSIPLAFVDLFKMFPDLKKKYAAANEAVRPFFAVIFLVVRSFYWPLVSYHFWVASLARRPGWERTFETRVFFRAPRAERGWRSRRKRRGRRADMPSKRFAAGALAERRARGHHVLRRQRPPDGPPGLLDLPHPHRPV